MPRVRPFHVERDGETTAWGAKFPADGPLVVMWNRRAFPVGERTEDNVISIYQDEADAEEATGGELMFYE